MNHVHRSRTYIKWANRDTFDFMLMVYKKTAWKSLSVALFLDWQRKPGVLGSITAGQQGMYSNVCSSIPACNSMTRQPVPFPVPSPNWQQKKIVWSADALIFLFLDAFKIKRTSLFFSLHFLCKSRSRVAFWQDVLEY